tara:strand:- start:3 stop:302 length:300 start_codon:yes stop_codon:yes gene_type:complete
MHPILEPLVSQLPDNAISRKLIESDDGYIAILEQLSNEGKWCKNPEKSDNDNKTGILYLEKNGYSEWIKDAEEVDFVRMVGVLQLLYDTCAALKEEEED